MIRLGLIACAIALATTCTAAQAGCDFLKTVKVLQPGYDPTSVPYSSPAAPQNIKGDYTTLRPEIQADLTAAYANAPQKVQDHLCSLTGVFIDPSGCPGGDVNNCNPFTGGLFATDGSWGFRARPAGDKGHTYIAISGGLWYLGGASHAEAFPIYENSLLQSYARWSGGPTITTAVPPDQPWMTVLAALAHEMGHVRWAQVAIPQGAGMGYKFYKLQHCPLPNSTTIDFFQGWDYGGKAARLRPPNRWRYFDERDNDNGEPYTEHAYSPFLVELYYNGNPPSILNQNFDELYEPGEPWASLFGAQTPDEDFVETYVLYALLGRKFDDPTYAGVYLQSLPVQTPGYADRDIPADLLKNYKLNLADKMRCVRDLP